jgi:hypothetical protein
MMPRRGKKNLPERENTENPNDLRSAIAADRKLDFAGEGDGLWRSATETRFGEFFGSSSVVISRFF